MDEPLKSGDLAEVIDGTRGRDSPNLGLVVEVLRLVGECPKLGKIWRCHAEFAESIRLGPGCTAAPDQADFAASWLRKIAPPTPTATQEKTLELTS